MALPQAQSEKLPLSASEADTSRQDSRLCGLRVIPGYRLPPHLKFILAAEIVLIYAATRLRLSRRSLGEVVSLIRSRPPRRLPGLEPGSQEAQLAAARLGSAVQRTLRALPSDTRCLTESLVLSSALIARGIPSSLVIGARSKPDFAAHAWVEHQGRPLLPQRDFDGYRLLEI